MPPIWVGFWVQNPLNKGPLFGRFSLTWVGFPEIGKKFLRWVPSFLPNFHHKSGHDGNFLKTGRQTPVHPQVMYPPPPGIILEVIIMHLASADIVVLGWSEKRYETLKSQLQRNHHKIYVKPLFLSKIYDNSIF